MARSSSQHASSKSVHSNEEIEEVDESYLAALAVERNTKAFFDKYDRNELQELVAATYCSWLQTSEEIRLPVEFPNGLINQMNDFSHSNIVILAPVEPNAPLDYKEVHQILKELVIGIFSLNQIPSIHFQANYDCSTTCLLPPAYYDSRVGQLLINVDYTMKTLWHGVCVPKEKRKRYAEWWRANVDLENNGIPQARKYTVTDFLAAGLTDVSTDPDFEGIYSDDVNTDPTYEPNSCLEKQLFMEYADSFLLQIILHNTYVKQHENIFVYETAYTLNNAIQLTDDKFDPVIYQKLQQRLGLQQKVVLNYLERKEEIQQNMAYLKLIAFLVPLLLGLKKKRKVPELSRFLPAFSDEKLKTDRILPPFLLGESFRCQHFTYPPNQYFHLHGGIEFDLGTPPITYFSREMKDSATDIQTEAASYLNQLLHSDVLYRGQFPIPIMEFSGKSYYAISVDLETFFQHFNKAPWWGVMSETISSLKSKKLPLSDIQLYEQLKKKFGTKKAMKCKNLPTALLSSVDSGLVAIFHTLCHNNPTSHLAVLDEVGYPLVYHAAMYNHPPIIYQLATSGLKLNQRRSIYYQKSNRSPNINEEKIGPTALHAAAKCGSLGALTCLLALQADYMKTDGRGWTPMHFAAFFDHIPCVRALYRKNPNLLDLETTAEYRSTPLLLAAMVGALDVLQYLLSIGANWRKTDSKGNNLIHLAALYFHTEVLKYFIEQDMPGLPVWNLLIGMVETFEYYRNEMGVRALEVLCVAKETYWKSIIDADGIPALVNMLRSQHKTLQCVAAAVLCNISNHQLVCHSIVQAKIIPELIELLMSPEPELQSRCSLLLYDIGQIDDNAAVIVRLGGISPMVKLLSSKIEDVLVNVIKCLMAIYKENPDHQTLVAQEGAIPLLVEMLSMTSDVLQETASIALAELACDHRSNQVSIADEGSVDLLINILGGTKLHLQLKAAKTVEALADRNPTIQKAFLERSADKYLLKLLKVFDLEVREQASTAIWALAGNAEKQQKSMAEQIGYSFIIDLLLSPSDNMRYVGSEAVISISKDNKEYQNQICAANGIPPLVRILRRSESTVRTLLRAIVALGTLCIGVAYINNEFCQNKIAEEGGMTSLVDLLSFETTLEVKVEVVHALARIVLGNPKLQLSLHNNKDFSYRIPLSLLTTGDKKIGLRAGSALALFSYNNPAQQALILDCGGIQMSIYEDFLQSKNEEEKVSASFQIVALGKVIVGRDVVALSAMGITTLVKLLTSHNFTTVIKAGELLAALCRTRGGISDAIVTMGAVEKLCAHLDSTNEQIQKVCAVTLGYLTFNLTAQRRLMVQCRNQPKLFDLLISALSIDATICMDFIEEFKRQKKMGLPSQSLEINGGPPVIPIRKVRPKSVGVPYKESQKVGFRTKSAPAVSSEKPKTAVNQSKNAQALDMKKLKDKQVTK
ncbi:ankyrin and armadillo repeat-containing protein [Callorhinchus milii]|nr:ankyrin and armadillo repeat-containing protein [Callorhinchus milii]